MSQQSASLGQSVDPFRFAADARILGGEVEVAKMSRLLDLLANTAGKLAWRVEGSMTDTGPDGQPEPRLHVQASGELRLNCQRCLDELSWQLQVEVMLQPVRTGQPIPDEELENDAVDAVEVEERVDLLVLVEDEILLALPLAPRHENCASPHAKSGAAKESPFAALASLRGSHRAD